MKITKSILCLWFGSSISAACASFIFGSEHVLKLMIDGGDYNGGDGPMNISINLPLFGIEIMGYFGGILALIGLLLSRFLNKQAIISWPHIASLLFLLPFALALVVRLEV